MLAQLRTLPDDARAAMVVGHNPTMQTLSQGLLAPRDKKGLSLAVRFGFPTCALGVYRFNVEGWTDVAEGAAKLVALMAPPLTQLGAPTPSRCPDLGPPERYPSKRRMAASPWPPPPQSATAAVEAPRRRSSSSAVRATRVPDMPTG